MKQNIISPEELCKKMFSERKKETAIFLFSFLIGIIIYIPMITKWLTNPDGVWQGLVYKRSYDWENMLGRTGIGMINKFKGFFLYPSLQTVFCLFLVAVIAVLLCEMFKVKSIMWGGLIGLLLMVSPSLCSTLTYYYTADAYMIAYMLSVLFVYLLIKSSRKSMIVYAAVLLALSVSIYQAYVGTAVTLCLLFLLYQMLISREEWKQVINQGIRFLVAGAAGLILYLGAYKVFCIVTGIQPVADRGFDSMGKISVRELSGLVESAYCFFVDYYFTDNLYSNSWHWRDKANVLVFGILAVLLVYLVIKIKIYKSIRKVMAVVLMVILLPIAFMSIVIMAPEVSIQDVTGILMLPHMNFLYIFLIVLMLGIKSEKTGIVTLKWGSLVVCTYVAFVLILYTQVFQNCMKLEVNKTTALAERIVQKVEELPEYHPGMKLIVVGSAENGNYPRSYPQMYYVVKGTAVEAGFFWSSANGRQHCWNQFLRQYLGVEYSVCGGSELENIYYSDECFKMPNFPAEGSVKMIGDCAVIKLSE